MDHIRPQPATAKAGLFGSFRQIGDVFLCRRGETLTGTLYLAPHHLIFSWTPEAPLDEKVRPRQIWITYPMISGATLRIAQITARQRSAVRLQCRDFTFVALQFCTESQARDTFETVKSLTCNNLTLSPLLAFSYRAPPEEAACRGWHMYDARREFRRMGISQKLPEKGWRVSDINHDYTYSPTYPAALVVPSSVSDNVLKHGGPYRSKARIPALTYLHPVNNCSITRSSQPMVGLFKGRRNPQDERLVAAIFATSHIANGDGHAPKNIGEHDSNTDGALAADIQQLAQNATIDQSKPRPDQESNAARIYGAQQRNLIVDARPTLNARVNQAAGMGSENMEYYKDATINYLGIDNIHVMRESLGKVVESLSHSDYTNLPPDQELLTRSKWLKYIRLLLRGADLVAHQIGINHSHVLIHCSDGWDRTSQISTLSQLCLDPYYRTIEGFITLVEKDWLSFGHMFRKRTGPLNSVKWFNVENEGNNGRSKDNSPGVQVNTKAIGNAFMSAKGFFTKKNDSSDSLEEEDMNTNGGDWTSLGAKKSVKPGKDNELVTKTSETSPMFHQFLDATWQLSRQHPTRFEFNERFLRRLLYHLYSCQYGTFLYDSERERVQGNASEKTHSVWDYFLARREQFINQQYDANINDNIAGQERLLFPDTKRVRWWAELFGRTDVEMNGTASAPAPSLPRDDEPVVTGIESEDVAAGTGLDEHGTYRYESNDPLAFGAEKLLKSLSDLTLPIRNSTAGGASRACDSGPDAMPANADTDLLGREREAAHLSTQSFAQASAFRE